MKSLHLRKNLHEHWLRRVTAAMAALVFTGSAATTWADALYIITGAQDQAIIMEEGVRCTVSSPLLNVYTRRGEQDIYLSSGQTVTVCHNGATITTRARKESVTGLLERLHIEPAPTDMISVDVSEGITLSVASDITYHDTVIEDAPSPVRRVPNAAMPAGTERVVTQGSDGVRTCVYEVVWANGAQLSRHFLKELHTTATETVVEYGTAVDSVSSDDVLVDVIPNADGSGTMAFSAVKNMTATAYTAGYDGVGTRTASGTTVRKGVVAVDRKVIPLGTKMFVVANGGIVYGTAVAEDTGVIGNKVDLYHDTYRECIQFGRRGCTVYILE